MPEIEDQRMTQPVGAQVKGLIVAERVVESFIDIESGVKIVPDFGALQFRIAITKNDSVCFAQIHEEPPEYKSLCKIVNVYQISY